MLQHDQLFDRFLIHDERTGDLIEIPAEQAGQQFVNFRLICNKANVHPDWFNVMRASGLMYQQLENQAQSLQELAEICTQADLKLLAGELQSMLQAIRLTQRCALEGVETCVAKFN